MTAIQIRMCPSRIPVKQPADLHPGSHCQAWQFGHRLLLAT
jgi:hypothetical protein